jgi:hypothetical protein
MFFKGNDDEKNLKIQNIESSHEQEIESIKNKTEYELQKLAEKYFYQTAVIKVISPFAMACVALFFSIFVLLDLLKVFQKKIKAKEEKILKSKIVEVKSIKKVETAADKKPSWAVNLNLIKEKVAIAAAKKRALKQAF